MQLKNKFLKIDKPFFYGLIPLAHIAEWTSNHDIIRPVTPSARNRLNMVNMILFKRLVTPIALTLLYLILLQNITSGIITAILLDLSIPISPTCVMFCSMRSNIGTAFLAEFFSVGLFICLFATLYLIGIFHIILFTSLLLTLLAMRVKSVFLPLVSIKVLRGSRQRSMTTSTFFCKVFSELRRSFLMPLMDTFSILFVHTFPTGIVKARPFRPKGFFTNEFRHSAFKAELVSIGRNGLLWLRMLTGIPFTHVFTSAWYASAHIPVSTNTKRNGIEIFRGSRKEVLASGTAFLWYSIHTSETKPFIRQALGCIQHRKGIISSNYTMKPLYKQPHNFFMLCLAYMNYTMYSSRGKE